jgi:hypothetical protein
MKSRPRSRLSTCLSLSLIISLSACFLTVLAGILFETVASNRAFQQYPPPGELIDVGGYRLHVVTQGEPKRPANRSVGQRRNVFLFSMGLGDGVCGKLYPGGCL